MLRRFFAPAVADSQPVTLTGSEAHHLIHVMRAKAGDRVELFDGSGWSFEAEVQVVRRKQVILAVVSRCQHDRELPFELTLAVALPRGDRQDWLVQKAVELGVTELVAWDTERGVAKANAKVVQRMQRSVIEASKQCRRDRLMRIADPTSLQQYVQHVRATRPTTAKYFAHPAAPSRESLYRQLSHLHSYQNGLILGVGPEGGFSQREVDCANQCGWQPVSLGKTILRTETAAIAATALVALQADVKA